MEGGNPNPGIFISFEAETVPRQEDAAFYFAEWWRIGDFTIWNWGK